MYKLKSISEFVLEASNISKIRKKLANATSKVNSYETKARAAAEEANFRKEQLEYEQQKEVLQGKRDSASDKVEKEKAKQELAKMKKSWKGEKKGLMSRYRNLRKSA